MRSSRMLSHAMIWSDTRFSVNRLPSLQFFWEYLERVHPSSVLGCPIFIRANHGHPHTPFHSLGRSHTPFHSLGRPHTPFHSLGHSHTPNACTLQITILAARTRQEFSKCVYILLWAGVRVYILLHVCTICVCTLCCGQVVLTAILWGAGTALGEVPPYLISYSATVAGKKAEALEEIEQVCVCVFICMCCAQPHQL